MRDALSVPFIVSYLYASLNHNMIHPWVSKSKKQGKLDNHMFLQGGATSHLYDPSPRSATVNGSSKRIFLSTEKVFSLAWNVIKNLFEAIM